MSIMINIKRFAVLFMLVIVLALSACADDKSNMYAGASGMTASENMEKAKEADPPQKDCWQGTVLNQVYDVIGTNIMSQYEALSRGSMTIMMVAFAVWVALRLLKFVSSVTETSPAEIWNEILRKAFICFVCGFLASSPTTLLYLINSILFPIYGTFLEFGSRILALSQEEVTSIQVFNDKINFVMKAQSCVLNVSELDAAQATIKEGFPSSYQQTMSCMICNLVEKLRIGRRMAVVAMNMEGLLPTIIGILVWCIFYVVGFAFVFYLVDSIFRMGMMILMLPIFVLSYAFGPTKKWAGIGFVNIMHSAAFVMAFSIVTATVLMAMIGLIADEQTGNIFNPTDPQIHFKQISIATLCLLLIGFLVWKSMDTSQELTNAIIGTNVDTKFQQNLKAAAQTVWKIFVGGLDTAAKKTGFYDATKLGRAMKAGNEFNNRLKTLAGRQK